ncbi:hypothetical protein [Hymenobacter gelipurpurascens]|nr:hypothetical protein [Hymenobacter gelipurpurascens]
MQRFAGVSLVFVPMLLVTLKAFLNRNDGRYAPEWGNGFFGLLFLGFLSVLSFLYIWQPYQKSVDIQAHQQITTALVDRISSEASKRTMYYAEYQYMFAGQHFRGKALLPETQAADAMTFNTQMFRGRKFLLLLSTVHPENSLMDVNCPQ